jgi:hypothetical protein
VSDSGVKSVRFARLCTSITAIPGVEARKLTGILRNRTVTTVRTKTAAEEREEQKQLTT